VLVTARVPRLGIGYARGSARLVKSPATRAKVSACVRALMNAPELPGPADVATIIPPTRAAYVRQVPGLALWIWYSATPEVLTLYLLADAPP
jgi:hypothetical protein